MNTLDYNDYDDALNLVNHCVLCLKNGGNTEDILFPMLKSFEADQAVFLSANNEGVDLTNSCVINAEKIYLKQYADYFWRYDPLYDKQFYPAPDNPVFKTDDIIPYSQMVKLEYYNSFLKPQNLLGELVIRLYSNHNVMGAICLQRFIDRPNFCTKDTRKASLLMPYLVNIFETFNKLKKINEELVLLEEWLESYAEGIILLDSQLKPLYLNSKARIFCLQMDCTNKKILVKRENTDIPIPKIIVKNCMNLIRTQNCNSVLSSHSNKIFNTENQKKYFVQYFPISSPYSELKMPRFIIFLSELTGYSDNQEDILLIERKLSEREENVARYTAIGLTNKQIAEKLNLSTFTVENHLKNIFKKTGLDSRVKLANLIRFSIKPLS